MKGLYQFIQQLISENLFLLHPQEQSYPNMIQQTQRKMSKSKVLALRNYCKAFRHLINALGCSHSNKNPLFLGSSSL